MLLLSRIRSPLAVILISLTLTTPLLPLVVANTEIRNFAASLERDVLVPFLERRAQNLDSSSSSSSNSNSDSDSGVNRSQSLDLDLNRTLNLNWGVSLSPAANARERSFAVVPAQLGTSMRDVCAHASLSHGRCPHELWLRLDLDGDGEGGGAGIMSWTHFGMFTLRLSWPAFYPTDFDIELYTPTEFASHIEASELELESISRLTAKTKPEAESEPAPSFTRTKYARIRLVDTGVRPRFSSASTYIFPSLYAPRDSVPPASVRMPVPVPFTLILEPLYLGFLPASLVPTFLLLAPALALAALALPWLNRRLGAVAAQARKELYHPGLQRKEKVE